MKAGTMEGLIGASMHANLAETPVRIYKDAERKGDTATMERAMGYAEQLTRKAHACQDQAEDELRKEMKENREEQKIQQKEQIEKHREEGKEQREISAEPSVDDTEAVVSEKSPISSSDKSGMTEDKNIASDLPEPKIYSSAGTIVETEISEPQISLKV